LTILFAIGLSTALVDHRAQEALFQFLFSIPSVLSFSNYSFSVAGGPVFGDLLQVWEQYGAVLAAFLVRKPGSGTFAMTINGFGQVLLNGTHSPHLLYGVTGLGADLVFALFKYKRYDISTVALAGLAASMFWYPIVYATHGVYLFPISFTVIDLIIRALGSTVGNGFLGAAIGILILSLSNQPRFKKI
jgi:ABC-type thiamin/hydroxymethylpyrimidine transport system permease subunit